MTLSWRPDAPPNLVKLAVGRCLIDVMDAGKWTELGLLTDTARLIENHPRLLRALHFGDDDYNGHVHDLVPRLLNEQSDPMPDLLAASVGLRVPKPVPPKLHDRFPNLDAVSDFLLIPAWLARADVRLFSELIIDDAAVATMPDGTVLSEAESAAARLGVAEMRRQVERIRRDHSDDPESAIGQAKELIETVCKTILGMAGDGGDEPIKLPALIRRTLIHLGVDPGQVDGRNATESRAAKQVLGGVSSILTGAAELRNARGTGHGRSGVPLVNASLARLSVGLVLPSVIYLIETYESTTEKVASSSVLGTMGSQSLHRSQPVLMLGMRVRHATFGEGLIQELSGDGLAQVATVDFGQPTGLKRLRSTYANLEPLR